MKNTPIHSIEISYELLSALIHKYFICEEVNNQRKIENIVDGFKYKYEPWKGFERPMCEVKLSGFFTFPEKVLNDLLQPINYDNVERSCIEFTCNDSRVSGTFKFLPICADPVIPKNPLDIITGNYIPYVKCCFNDLTLLSEFYLFEKGRINIYN